MDKFGIFNLLNSFFSLNPQNNEQSSTSNNGVGLASSLISSIGKNFLQQSTSPNKTEPKAVEESPKQNVPLPLQQNMLLTINSHDEFVKRVNQRHNLPTT